MTTATRSDVHRPTALVTEDYEYAYSYDARDSRLYAMIHVNRLLDEGYRFDGVHGGETCDHCGAHLRYVCVLKHLPTKTLIRVGETCLDNRFSRATADFHALRKQAALDRERQRIKRARLHWFAVDEDREVAYNWAAEQSDEFAYKFARTVENYGTASDRYVRAIMRSMARSERIAEERAAEAEKAAPVVEGSVQVTGEVVSVKLQMNAYGERLVMTVKDDRGFAVWGSVPAAISHVERGDRVTFMAHVEKSDRDETFGFFKRPRKADCVHADTA